MAGECPCPESAFVQAMLSYLAQTDSYFGEAQLGAENLTQLDKETYLHSVLHQSVKTFVTRYGDRFTPYHTQYFQSNFPDDEDLMYQLKLMQREHTKQAQRVKNRRFTAMKEMMANGDYFLDEQMKQRDPLLYDQMVGRYLSEEEIRSQSDGLLKQHTGFSTILLEQMDSKDNAEMYDRQCSQEEAQVEESDSDEDEQVEMSAEEVGETSPTDEEKMALREEFLHTMQERFLSGMDIEFNYETVDGDDRYDDLAQEGRDAEEKYFDASDEGSQVAQEEGSKLAPDEYDY